MRCFIQISYVKMTENRDRSVDRVTRVRLETHDTAESRRRLLR